MPRFQTITPQAALRLMEEKGDEITILDIRPEDEFEKEHVPGAENLDYHGHHFQEKAEKLDKNKNYIIYCKSGARGEYFMGKMKESGFSGAYNILGGFVAWKISRLPLVNGTDKT